LEDISLVAWWGAILSTIVFIWNIVKWKLSSPKLDVKVFSDSYIWKGVCEHLPGEREENGVKIYQMKPFVIVEVRNIGRSSTTLLNIRLAQYDSPKGMDKMMDTSEEHDPHSTVLPAILDAGHVWLCRFDQIATTTNNMGIEKQHFSIDIRHTHSKGWVRKAFNIKTKS
jgi:hypothetical protein